VTAYKPEGQTTPIVYATGTDKTIREVVDNGKDKLKYE